MNVYIIVKLLKILILIWEYNSKNILWIYQSLNLLKPFGFGNPTPLLISKNCMIYNMSTVGDNKHI